MSDIEISKRPEAETVVGLGEQFIYGTSEVVEVVAGLAQTRVDVLPTPDRTWGDVHIICDMIDAEEIRDQRFWPRLRLE